MSYEHDCAVCRLPNVHAVRLPCGHSSTCSECVDRIVTVSLLKDHREGRHVSPLCPMCQAPFNHFESRPCNETRARVQAERSRAERAARPDPAPASQAAAAADNFVAVAARVEFEEKGTRRNPIVVE